VDPYASAVTSDLSNLLRIFQKSFFTIGKKKRAPPAASALEGAGGGGVKIFGRSDRSDVTAIVYGGCGWPLHEMSSSRKV